MIITEDPEILKRERSLTFLDRIYWAYYVHLPFYLMTTGEAVVLHTITFIFFSFIIYAVGVYLPSSTISLSARIYYYITGKDLLHELFPKLHQDFEFNWFDVTNYLESLISSK